MKKIALVLALMMVLGSVACTAKKAEETVKTVESAVAAAPADTAAENTAQEEPRNMVGGWTLNAEMGENLSAEDKAVLDKAMEGYVGLSIKPIALLGTQVVAGINYAFLCETAPVVPNPQSKLSVIVVYQDLQGGATISDVRDFDLTAYVSESKSASTEQLEGGWTVNSGIPVKALREDAQTAFDKAFENLTGAYYQPIELLATQVVAGTNYAILCQCTSVPRSDDVTLVIVKIYADLSGNATVENFAEIDIASLLG